MAYLCDERQQHAANGCSQKTRTFCLTRRSSSRAREVAAAGWALFWRVFFLHCVHGNIAIISQIDDAGWDRPSNQSILIANNLQKCAAGEEQQNASPPSHDCGLVITLSECPDKHPGGYRAERRRQTEYDEMGSRPSFAKTLS